MAGDEEHAVDIDLHDLAPQIDRGIDDGAAAADADIVVEEVEPAEAFTAASTSILHWLSSATSATKGAAVPPSASIILTV